MRIMTQKVCKVSQVLLINNQIIELQNIEGLIESQILNNKTPFFEVKTIHFSL